MCVLYLAPPSPAFRQNIPRGNFLRAKRATALEVLAFDVGESVVGVLDVNTGEYTPYRENAMVDGTRRVVECEGAIVSFNGTHCDLPWLARILALKDEIPSLKGNHYDMLEIAVEDRWGTRLGGKTIIGPDLRAHYKHYFGLDLSRPPASASDEYEENNWEDCWMAGELWKRLCRVPRLPKGH